MTEADANITQDPAPETTTEVTTEAPQIPTNRKVSKGEKKFKKAMSKMGMKPVDGITRVTLKTSKNFILYIDGPEVMKAPGAEESYIVFGEARFLDFTKNAAASQLDKFKTAQDATPVEGGDANAEGNTTEATEIPEETIDTLIEYTSCTKEQAVEALTKTGGDLVEAISLLS